ncbi:PhzF family phenazine biosynthesis protein [Acetonema longum]|uniref:Epimerase, PhzC/PhzF-like protein n=1 Tax=Acetonema longum DSM 6540 TaxID=1009370 RepID=F7NGE4_9FIRM|nr:PhzF family phenazine biosynthesis protein [Acetonema longum]EGO64899.1 epimerase, PhzC/PhzF-like protein [Acetonema longum DSM 6540]
MLFYIVDAFADKPFGGNAAGVVILGPCDEFPSDEIMINVAAELKYSETAFVKPISGSQFKIRYFMPAAEVDLCGHATIGAFGVLMDCGLVRDNAAYLLDTRSGQREVSLKDGLIIMDMSSPKVMAEITSPAKLKELTRVMGISAGDVGMTPQLISTGLPDIILNVKTKEALMKIKPDFPALAKLSEEYQAVGVHAFALNANRGTAVDQAIAHCRNFAPLYAIGEEAATGTSNGALTFYLYKHGFVQEEKWNLFLQGESMNRPSRIMSILQRAPGDNTDQAIRIKIGGDYKILVKGDLYL